MDFQKGATEEIKDVNKFYNVARALERVQGMVREQLEAYRVQVRMAALEEATRLRKARYEAIHREEARVLQRQAESTSRRLANPQKQLPPQPAKKPPLKAKLNPRLSLQQ